MNLEYSKLRAFRCQKYLHVWIKIICTTLSSFHDLIFILSLNLSKSPKCCDESFPFWNECTSCRYPKFIFSILKANYRHIQQWSDQLQKSLNNSRQTLGDCMHRMYTCKPLMSWKCCYFRVLQRWLGDKRKQDMSC